MLLKREVLCNRKIKLNAINIMYWFVHTYILIFIQYIHACSLYGLSLRDA